MTIQASKFDKDPINDNFHKSNKHLRNLLNLLANPNIQNIGKLLMSYHITSATFIITFISTITFSLSFSQTTFFGYLGTPKRTFQIAYFVRI